MARTSAARSQGRRSKHQPPPPARCCSTGTYSNAHPPTGFPGHASRVIAAGTARWSHPYRPCLADGYQQSPAVNDGSLRSVLTWPFGVRAGAALPRGSAFQARDPHPPTMPLSGGGPMVDRADPTGGGALELARSAATAPARRRTALAAVARPPPRWLGCCWWRSCAARGRGRPHSAWHDRWRVDSPVGARLPRLASR
jgi:hypothetical protein